MKTYSAIIADDEEELRKFLRLRMSEIWPDLKICGEAKNGREAVALIETQHPDIAFLDIRMPGLSGIDVAREIGGRCHVVFITAYDQYAIEAFENEAVDYLLKPVDSRRLKKTVERVQRRLKTSSALPENFSVIAEKLISRLSGPKTADYLKWIKAQHGSEIRLISTDDISYFKAADKYTLVISKFGESLINKPIKELALELDPEKFWQIHRSTIVNVACVSKVSRSLTGRHVIKLAGIEEPLTVSRTYAHLFKQM
jgi:DNA-binding LytR/AlgR family response regulator